MDPPHVKTLMRPVMHIGQMKFTWSLLSRLTMIHLVSLAHPSCGTQDVETLSTSRILGTSIPGEAV